MSEKPNHYDTKPSKRDAFDEEDPYDDFCEHGVLVTSECLACEVMYEAWRDERDW